MAYEYGDIPSKDELIKLGSLDKIKERPPHLRNNFLQKATYIYNTYSNKEVIDYILTLSQLIVSNYPIDRYWNSEWLLILIYIYNGILTKDYIKYNKIMNKNKIMKALYKKINNIVNQEDWNRRKVVTKSICDQFIKKYEQLLQDDVEFSNFLLMLPMEIDSFICYGYGVDLGESIDDISLIKNKR